MRAVTELCGLASKQRREVRARMLLRQSELADVAASELHIIPTGPSAINVKQSSMMGSMYSMYSSSSLVATLAQKWRRAPKQIHCTLPESQRAAGSPAGNWLLSLGVLHCTKTTRPLPDLREFPPLPFLAYPKLASEASYALRSPQASCDLRYSSMAIIPSPPFHTARQPLWP